MALTDPVVPPGEGALLAGHVAIGTVDDEDLHRVVAATCRQCRIKVDEGAAPAVSCDVDGRGPDGLGCEHSAVDDQVRISVDQHRVLAGRGLTLHRVDHDDGVLARLVRRIDDRVHLATGREPASAATREAGALDLGDERAGVSACGGGKGRQTTEGRCMGLEVRTGDGPEQA